MSNNKSLLIIFVKNAELGKVKTRLAATVGNEVALAVYFQLLNKTREVALTVETDKVVYFSNHVEESGIWQGDTFQKAVQSKGDLGDRMKNAFKDAFGQGYQRVCIIGSDCMDISSEIIAGAFDQLLNHDTVIGPSEDGGYYLLGMRKFTPTLFENKSWSTDQVYSTTLDDIKRLGLSRAELPTLNDVDTEKDLGDWAAVVSDTYKVD
jgi:rSAM/selenodomain-associated transferase 1